MQCNQIKNKVTIDGRRGGSKDENCQPKDGCIAPLNRVISRAKPKNTLMT